MSESIRPSVDGAAGDAGMGSASATGAPPPPPPPPPLQVSAVDREAMTVAMTIVPGVYSRNKMFAMFKDARVKAARRRSATLRGVARQLVSSEIANVEVSRGEDGACVLSYRVRAVRLARRVELSEVELACVAYVARRGGSRALEATERERTLIDAALARLASGLALSGLEGLASEPRRG